MSDTINIDDFLSKLMEDKSKERGSKKDRLTKVFMNTKNNMGILTYVPVMSKETNSFWLKIPSVFEYNGNTSLLNKGEGWYKILPADWYPNMTPEQKALHSEVRSYLEYIREEVGDWDEIRVRNYSLFHGITLSLKNEAGEKNEEIEGCPCLYVYPSVCAIDALNTAISSKVEITGGKRDWIPMIFSLKPKREAVMQISFKRGTGAGYVSSVNFEMNSGFNTVVPADLEITEHTNSIFDRILPAFLGWLYDDKEDSPFNEVAFKELRDQLKIRVKQIESGETEETKPADDQVQYENKNNLQANGGAEVTKSTPF